MPEDQTDSDTLLFEYPNGNLDLEYTLSNGQLFRWRKSPGGWWDVVKGDHLLRVREVPSSGQGVSGFQANVYPPDPEGAVLRRFFRLDVDLEPVYEAWNAEDPYLGSLTQKFGGLRLVLQEPEECLLQFMCSTANFIPRIMRAVAMIAQSWGEPIQGPGGKPSTHAFPRAQVIARLDPNVVSSKTGLEWRAANLVKVAQQVAARGEQWLEQVSALDYPTARAELMRIEGVGPKIADCVCLFAMGKDQAVPVDTHVWQLTREHYLPSLRGKSPGPAGYAQVVSYFQTHFVKPGWAQQYLFYDHLLASRTRRAGSQE